MSKGPANIFALGDTVRITVGVFADFIGRVYQLDAANRRADVMLKINGRSTPVEVDFDQLERVAP